jgi:hypothetical protein
MKVYSCPAQVPPPKPDYSNYIHAIEIQKENQHRADLTNWLKCNGFPGQHTGKTISFQVADGYAEYMLADGPTSCLIHLPYGDGYSFPEVAFLPKKEILRRIDADAKFKSYWEKGA